MEIVTRDPNKPLVLAAAPAEDQRALLMQYVSIEWPDAEIRELDTSAQGMAGIDTACIGCDLVMIFLAPTQAADLGWLDRMQAAKQHAPIVAVTDGESTLSQALLLRGAYCHERRTLSNAEMRTTLKAAMRERLASLKVSHRTTLMDTQTSRAMEKTQPMAMRVPRHYEIRGYRLLKKLGRGGMSEVFLARRIRDNRVCALKILEADHPSPAALDFFIEECTVISGLDSPFVVRIYDHGITDDYLFVAMEYIEGGDLRERMSKGISPEQAMDILCQLARALQVIHQAGLMHGDIKPQNIMFRDLRSLVLVDFGVSRVIETSSSKREGQIVGTPAYISPEHVLGQPLDGRSDLYSSGVLFYEMLTGQMPFTAPNVDQLMRMHAETPMPRLPSRLRNYQDLLDRLSAKRPSDRFINATELNEYLHNISMFGSAESVGQSKAARR
jgi:eukaryotic-like serine/threonine-protein kinase